MCHVIEGRLGQPPPCHTGICRSDDVQTLRRRSAGSPGAGRTLDPRSWRQLNRSSTQKPSSGPSPNVRPGRPGTAFTAKSTPGMNDVLSYASWRIVSDCPTAPNMTS